MAALYSLLVYLSGLAVAAECSKCLLEAGLKYPVVQGGGPVGGATGGALLAIFGLFLAAGGVVSPIVAAVRASRRPPGAEWILGAGSALVGTGLLVVASLLFQSPNLTFSAILGTAWVGLLAPLRVRAGLLAALLLPLAGGLAFAALGALEAVRHKAIFDANAPRRNIERHASEGEDTLLKADLDALPAVDAGPDLSGLASSLAEEDRMGPLASILHHPKVRDSACLRALRAALDGGAAQAFPAAPDEACALSAVYVALRSGRHETLEPALRAYGPLKFAPFPLFFALRAKDEPGATADRLLKAARVLDSKGRIDPRWYGDGLVRAYDDELARKFILARVRLDPFLVAAVNYFGNRIEPVRELIEKGARASARGPCGMTALAASLGKWGYNAELVELLLKNGANPNLAAPSHCEDTGPGPSLTALAHAEAATLGDENRAELIALLRKYGATDSTAPSDRSRDRPPEGTRR